ncbi:pyridoxamine 5'-phosphate oxidase family protein [Streptomyces sp. NPDC056690]|uniref:pyridoxamine 5'-phosphate oxidase family protein n=1 Tax=unclassified Streptomyces TaxID=2593676 RepID=UPI00363BE74D
MAAKSGPAPRVLTDEELHLLLDRGRFGTPASVRRTGHPHLSTVLHHWSPGERVLRFSTTADRLKTRQLRSDPRAAPHVSGPDMWSFAVAEGEAEVSDVTAAPGDDVGRELLAMTAGFDDPAQKAEFLGRQVGESRVVIRLRVTRLYGTALDIPK